MFVFSWLPIALLGAVVSIVAGVSVGVEIVERRGLAGDAAPKPRRFRPVVIQGGRVDAPAVVAADIETLAG
jgi:hypothetical protein